MNAALGGGKGNIVCVGLDPDVSRVFQIYLTAYGFDVQTYSLGEEALEACRQSLPDAVILTPNLPDVDGSELCRQIRAIEHTRKSFILAVLVTEDRAAKLAALEAGADDVVVRPIDIEEIRLKIESVLGI